MRKIRYVAAVVASALAVGLPTVSQAAPKPHPVVLAARATPWAMSAAPRAYVVTGKVRDAQRCWVRILSGPTLSGLPGNHPCAKGTYRLALKLGANGSERRTWKLELRAHRNGAKDAIGVFYLTQAPAPAVVNIPTTTTTAAPQVPTATTTTTTTPAASPLVFILPPSPTTTVPALPTTTVPVPVSLDPTCTQLTSAAYTLSCYFSVSDVGGAIEGGTLSFATTMAPNDQGAALLTPATPGCTINVTPSNSSSTCLVSYASSGPGTYYAETVYYGGPGAYSASTMETVYVAAPPTTTTTAVTTTTQPTTTTTAPPAVVSAIFAFPRFINGLAPAPCNPGGYECAAFGVDGLPAQGTVTVTDDSTGAACSIDLATQTVCFAQDSLTGAQVAYPNWQLSAVWSATPGTVTTFTMQPGSGAASPPLSNSPTGTWWDFQSS